MTDEAHRSWFFRQAGRPAFPDMLWSKPETRHGAGKLLIIGGQAHELHHVSTAYTAATSAGAGSIRVLLPESTRRVTDSLPHIEYAPANNSGSFARTALAELLDAASWADGVLLAGDLGKNSETSLLLDTFISKTLLPLTIASHAVPSLSIALLELSQRPQTLICLSFIAVQKVLAAQGGQPALTSTMPIAQQAAILRNFSHDHQATLAVSHNQNYWVSSNATVSLTKSQQEINQDMLASQLAVWFMQQPSKPLQAATCALWELATSSHKK